MAISDSWDGKLKLVSHRILIERISIELTNRCAKACRFCYNRSSPDGATEWSPADVVNFVCDCARHGVRDVSFGGGEPLEYPQLYDVLAGLRGLLHRSVTTNGLKLDDAMIASLARTGLEKVHVSIHFPEHAEEVARVIRQVRALEDAGIRSGVNLLVAGTALEAGRQAVERLVAAGIDMERIILLPMRLHDIPTAQDVARIAGGRPFQSTSCLKQCAPSPRFVSLNAKREVGWCSYTRARRQLKTQSWQGLMDAVEGLGMSFCGGEHDGGQ